MSKNFELLQNIGNEKDLFQTLGDWEDVDEASANAGQVAASDEKTRARTPHQSALPDVFQTVNETLGPLDFVAPDLSCDPEPVRKPIQASLRPLEKEADLETHGAAAQTRFPISRNPITRLSPDLGTPPLWVKPDIGPAPNDEVELELEPETFPSVGITESQQTPERAAGASHTKVQKPSPAKEPMAPQEPMRSPSFRIFGVGEGRSTGESRAKKGRGRHEYRDPRREAIAHEEELKLVQRIFLAEENSQRMVQFSGFERDTGCAAICIRSGEILAAQTEGSVCLVDMGFRAPLLHEYCSIPNDKGLAEAIAESSPIQEFATQLSPANLWVIPAGQGAPKLSFAKAADRARARMEELRKAFRYVVVYSGSLWLNSEAMLISKWTDGVVLILEAHCTRRDTARRIKESLAAANARVLGVVLNNRTYPIPETLYSRL